MLVKFTESDGDAIWVDAMRVVAVELPDDKEGCYIKLDGGYEITDPDPSYKPHDSVHLIDNGYCVVEPIDEVAVAINAAIREVRMLKLPYMTVNPGNVERVNIRDRPGD